VKLTRHVPEAGGVVTLHSDEDGWRAEFSHGGQIDLEPRPWECPEAALRALGLPAEAPWAVEFVEAARRIRRGRR
jgi:hypothetical protein